MRPTRVMSGRDAMGGRMGPWRSDWRDSWPFPWADATCEPPIEIIRLCTKNYKYEKIDLGQSVDLRNPLAGQRTDVQDDLEDQVKGT